MDALKSNKLLIKQNSLRKTEGLKKYGSLNTKIIKRKNRDKIQLFFNLKNKTIRKYEKGLLFV